MERTLIEKYVNKTGELPALKYVNIGNWEYKTARHTDILQFETVTDWQPYTGETAVPTDQTVFLRTKFTLPSDSYDDRFDRFLILDVTPAIEAFVKIDGQPRQGLDLNRNRVMLRGDENGREIIIELEMYCSFRHEAVRDVRPLVNSCYTVFEKSVEQYHLDLKTAWHSLPHIDNGYTREKIQKAIEDSIRCFDLTGERDEVVSRIPTAQAVFAEAMSRIPKEGDLGNIHFVAHTHIDDAWLWQVKDTVRKTGRSVINALRLMEEYPEYEFSFSQPQLYAFVKKYYPELMPKIKEKIKEGRWHLVGPMWVEPDLNMPSGECLIRQIMYGHQFYLEEFGQTSDVCFIPDSFGFPASLPQIFVKCGLKYFVTTKVRWQQKNTFPYNVFKWEGIDGTQILATIPALRDGYTGIIDPEACKIASDRLSQRSLWDNVMFPYGYGDGGGGANRHMLENYRRLKDYPGMPKAKIASCNSYFGELESISGRLPVWSGELYVETHQGTLTTIAKCKKHNRMCETLLRRVELLCVMADKNSIPYDYEVIRGCYKDLFLLQFHDILPGSSVREVYDDAEILAKKILNTAQSIETELSQKLCPDGISVLNPNGFTMTGEVSFDAAVVEDSLIFDGEKQLDYVVDDGKAVVLIENAEPFSFKRLTLRSGASERKPGFSEVSYLEDGVRIENKFFALTVHNDGRITNAADIKNDRRFIGDIPANKLRMYLDGPMYEDAWNIDGEYRSRAAGLNFESGLSVTLNSPQKTVLTVTNVSPKVKITQNIIFYKGVARIDFQTSVDWQEESKLLKVSFPVEVRSNTASYEIAYGLAERPTHPNNSFEQAKFECAGHRFIDISEEGYGVSLLNDCKYGFDVLDGTLSISLLRNTHFPAYYIEKGLHEFTYSLYPHTGSLAAGGTVKAAAALNAPLTAYVTNNESCTTAESSLISSDNPNLIIDAVKPAENGNGYIARLYECHGSRGTARLTVCGNAVFKTTPLEENDKAVEMSGGKINIPFSPFEIITLRIV